MSSFLKKAALFFYRVIGCCIILFAVMSSFLYFMLPIFVSTNEIKKQVLYKINLPINFESISWGVWGISPTIIIDNIELYKNKVEKVTIEIDWIAWLKQDKIKIKKIIFEKAKLFAQYREDKIYLDDLSNYPLLFNQEKSTSEYEVSEVSLVNSELIIRNEDNQLFETKKTEITVENTRENFKINVTGELVKENSSFQFGLSVLENKKMHIYISGENIALSDLSFFFRNIIISGEAEKLKLWIEGKSGKVNRLIAQGKINDFIYEYESRKLRYDYLSGQFGIEWKPEKTEYLGLDISMAPKFKGPYSQFYVSIPEQASEQTPEQTPVMILLAKDFSLNYLDNIGEVFLAEKLELMNWWHKVLPRGNLIYLNTRLSGIDPISLISSEIIIQDLKINKNPFHLSFDKIEHFSGYYENGLGKLFLKGKKARFQDNYYYPDGLPLEDFSGNIWYWDKLGGKKIYFDNIAVKIDKAKIDYDGLWVKNMASNLWETESLFFQSNLDFKKVVEILPKSLIDKGLTEWLQSALISGHLKETKGVIRGYLRDFPFTDSSTGVLEADMKVEGATVQYQANWPALKKADGEIVLEGPQLTLSTKEAEVFNSQVISAEGKISNLNEENPTLILGTKITSTFTKAKDFIEHSPLKEILSEKLQPFQIVGPVDLLLDLKIPLNLKSAEKLDYRGALDFKKAQVKVPNVALNISSVNGALFFCPRGLSGKNISGNMFGSPSKFTIVSDILSSDPRLKISATGQVEVQKLSNFFKLPNNTSLIKGETNYTASLLLKQEAKKVEGELNVNSDLFGITLDLPKPFQKKPDEKEDFKVSLQFSPQPVIDMKIKYGKKIEVDYKLNTTKEVFLPDSVRAVLGEKPIGTEIKTEDSSINTIPFFSKNPFSIEGYLETLDLAEWKALFPDSKSNAFTSSFSVKLNIGKLKVFDQDFDNISLQVAPAGLLNREITVLSQNIKGKIILPIGSCSGAIKADFDYLNFSKDKNKESKTEKPALDSIKTKAGDCPIELTVKKLNLNEKVIENFYIHLVPEKLGFKLKEIRANAPSTTLQASGFWTLIPKSNIDLKGIIQTKNIQNTLKAGGIESTLYAATGQIRFDLDWEKDFTDIDLNSVNGNVRVFLRDGYIKGAEPGIGRILSLLSIDNIQRRLKLDFSDVAKEGLSLDKLTASFYFGHGVMKTEDLVLDSPAARIELLGQANLDTKMLKGTMKVMPKITGSLPVAAAIAAANPAVGAAVWMADKVLGRAIQGITQYQYQLSGTIDKPILNSKSNEKKQR